MGASMIKSYLPQVVLYLPAEHWEFGSFGILLRPSDESTCS